MKYNILRSIDAGYPVAEDKPNGLSAARGIINGRIISIAFWVAFIAGGCIWMLLKMGGY